MRYPLWAFFFVFVLPPFTAHVLLTGGARMETVNGAGFAQLTTISPKGVTPRTVPAGSGQLAGHKETAGVVPGRSYFVVLTSTL